ncbi:uncharacterized protein LOC123006642 [Tribolium madens]|uniref:uncharacterized protein LOC123006642 n=1 Tax=Tribolium madens TaxID=41895 RepID=UPI001CF72672|nr:uncharacterized protein LOC123006642 [Tribolium madens]
MTSKRVAPQRVSSKRSKISEATPGENLFLSSGMFSSPFEDYAPLLKIYNPEHTTAICFSIDTFEDFLNQMEKIRKEMGSISEGQILCMLSNYVIVMCKHQTLQFLSRNSTVYKSLFLACDTVNVVLNMGEHLMSLLHSRRLQYKFYPCYQNFINQAALEVMEKGSEDFNQKLFDLIKCNYEQNGTLYEIVLKLPVNVKHDVDARIKYYKEHNDYNCL